MRRLLFGRVALTGGMTRALMLDTLLQTERVARIATFRLGRQWYGHR